MRCNRCGAQEPQAMMRTDHGYLCLPCYDERERFEERAAIMEHDGGLSREEAEREARKAR